MVVAVISTPVGAQTATSRPPAVLSEIGSVTEDRERLVRLREPDSGGTGFFKSLSSTPSIRTNLTRTGLKPQWTAVPPRVVFRRNAALPYSQNDGSLWAGRGSNVVVSGGIVLEWSRLRLLLVPEYVLAANDSFNPPATPPNPVPRAERSPYSSPWHDNGQSIDLPWRFGSGRVRQFLPGQSSIALDAAYLTVGFSTENEWWGPGIRNALILSNHAPGFTHAFIRTRDSWKTRVGSFRARWLVGWLDESAHFDTVSTNNVRAISMAGISWTPSGHPEIEIGIARSVYAPASGRLDAMSAGLNVLLGVGHPNARPYTDTSRTPGRDQLLSFFGRWTFPKDGLEAYAEWARSEFPRSLREFLTYPNHSQGYTLGMQWLSDSIGRGARIRAQAEATYLEQSTTYRFLPIGSWYTSRAVVQGYTNRGQALGASIGPGSSAQFLAVDYVRPTWRLGGYLNRIRWLEDAHSQQAYPNLPSGTRGWCEHDVSLLHGVRGAAHSRFGDVALDYSTGWRLNVFFENNGPCPISPGRDQKNRSLSLVVRPAGF